MRDKKKKDPESASLDVEEIMMRSIMEDQMSMRRMTKDNAERRVQTRAVDCVEKLKVYGEEGTGVYLCDREDHSEYYTVMMGGELKRIHEQCVGELEEKITARHVPTFREEMEQGLWSVEGMARRKLLGERGRGEGSVSSRAMRMDEGWRDEKEEEHEREKIRGNAGR